MRIKRFYLKGFEIHQKEISDESKCVFIISPHLYSIHKYSIIKPE